MKPILRSHRFEIFLLLGFVVFLGGLVLFKQDILFKKDIEKFRVAETRECDDNEAPIEELEIRFASARRLLKQNSSTVVLHQPEGCIQTGKSVRFIAVKRNAKNASKKNRRVPVGTLKIAGIFDVPFSSIPTRQQRRLEKKLKTKEHPEVLKQNFYLLKLELIEGRHGLGRSGKPGEGRHQEQ